MKPELTLAPLPNRTIISVGGEDAVAFLDNLLTNRIDSLGPDEARHAALLTPQGKVVADMLVFADGEGGLLLDVPTIAAPELLKKLVQYRLRSKVTLAIADELVAMALFGPVLPGGAELGIAARDPRAPDLGLRIVAHRDQADALADAAGASRGEATEYHAMRVAAGIGEMGLDYLPNEVFPHELNMDRRHGIDFKKGCYIGQEVVSRMQHRGTARTRLSRIRYRDGFGVEPGSAVLAGDRPVGTTASQANGLGLAMLRLDRVSDAMAAGEALLAGNVPIVLVD